MRDVALPFEVDALSVNQILSRFHYLGPIDRGFTYRDQFGVCVFANPSSRRLPQYRWLELVRWCLYGEKNGGSQQWRAIHAWLRVTRPEITTVVSYSDPSAGHTGSLYRACNWLWAPTWHRLREPPSGNGDWGNGRRQAVKDRWVFAIAPDADREALLRVNDEALRKRMPWAEFRERRGGDFKRCEQADITEGGEDFELIEGMEAALPVLPALCSNAEAEAASGLGRAFEAETMRMFAGVKVWAK